MAAEPVRIETVLEFFNAVLALPAIIIEVEDRPAAALLVGHQESQVGAGFGVFGLVADAALTKPALSPVQKTRKRALRLSAATIAASKLALKTSGSALEDRVGRHANGVLNAEEFAELIEQRQGKTSIRAQLDPNSRKFLLQARHQTQQQRHDPSVAGSGPSAQSGRQQAAGVALEDQQWMIHVLIVGTVEEAQLLMTIGGVVGGIHIQEDLTASSDLFATDAHEPIEQSLLQQNDLASGGRVLPSAQGGL